MAVKLGINIDHVATLRQQRRITYPSPLDAALAAECAGADGITCHLREDRRHIQDRDVYLLRERIKTRLNLEMAVSDEIVRIALKVKPDYVCLVPEKRQELTTEGGLNVAGDVVRLTKVVTKFRSAGIKVSLFIDPVEKQILAAECVGAEYVELHTGCYAEQHSRIARNTELKRLKEAAKIVCSCGLGLNAGHGLDYDNVVPIAKIDCIYELNIGFSIIARAVFTGIPAAVKEMKKLINVL
ncbi:MAG: pyridoxine 5'-phosphate synthase [Elusimicrobiota bacterium]